MRAADSSDAVSIVSSDGPSAPDYDVILIGGGINGTGVARDCALRGLRVALFEKNDLGFGASGNNSGMIHGGPRYLLGHPSVTEDSCRDSGNIQKVAQNLLFRIPFLYVVPGEQKGRSMALAAYDAFFRWYDNYQPLKGGKPHTLLSAADVRSLEPGLKEDVYGAVSFDEWGVDGARLCVLNAVDAREHAAKIFTKHEVTELVGERDAEGKMKRVTGVIAHDVDTGAAVRATARFVVNATGAWSPVVAALAPGAVAKVRPGKGIHVVFDRRISNYAVASNAIDGRQVFVMPWGDVSWIGTTDDDFYGDLDDMRATTDEVRYLVEGVARVMPSLGDARVIATTAGARPTLHEYGPLEDKLSREHEIVDHETKHGVAGLYSMIGGKLASYRMFSEEMTDVLAKKMGALSPCTTHIAPLPGNERLVDPRELSEGFGVSPIAARRLATRHGSRAHNVLGRAKSHKDDLEVVCGCEPVLACEIRHAVREEGARDLDDVARRTRLGWGSCGGMRCAHRAAEIVCEERKLSQNDPQNAPTIAARFLVERYRSRLPAMRPADLAQEELFAARFSYGGVVERAKRDGEDR